MSTVTDTAVFAVRCPECGRVELGADRLRLVVRETGAFYRFRCPGCDDSVRRPAGEKLVAMLAGGGVPSVSVAR
jgi:ribosomal protein S27E